MVNAKTMENLNKLDKLLGQFPENRAVFYAEKLGWSRSKVYDYFNSLQIRQLAYNKNGLWYPSTEQKPSKEKYTWKVKVRSEIQKVRDAWIKAKSEDQYDQVLKGIQLVSSLIPQQQLKKLISSFTEYDKEFMEQWKKLSIFTDNPFESMRRQNLKLKLKADLCRVRLETFSREFLHDN